LVQPRRSILELLHTVQYRHAITSMVLAWVTVEEATFDEVVCPAELPVGLSTLLSRGPRSLSASHRQPGVEPPHTCSPSSPTRAPSRRSSVQWSELSSQWIAMGLSTLQSWGPHSPSAVIYGLVLSLPTCTCWDQGCCCKRCRGQPSR
jgi:hypothetical protein